MQKFLRPALGLLSLLVAGCLNAATPHFAIIIDAGSSGSRLHLFQYENDSKIPLIQEIFSESTTPGLSSFADHPEAAAESLKKLLDDASLALQNAKIDPGTVSLELLATAGMRLLPEDTQLAIYSSLSRYLSQHYAFSLGDIKTIPGKMEGLFGWLDINYLSKSFESSEDMSKGSIDMGGASTQIVFSTEDTSKPEDEINLQIGEKQYTVFSKSFLGLGLVQALAEIHHHPLANSCYPDNYPFSQTKIGHFNFSSCRSLYLDLLNKQTVTQEILPLTGHSFIAYSGIYYTYHFFGLDKDSSQAHAEKQIQAVCGENWEQLSKEHKEIPEKYLASFCANGVYLDSLLYGIYQLNDQQLSVTNQIHQQEIDWTLGALLYQLLSSKAK